ncbi:MAG: CopD family protein [Alphaproteobacteria bacterium]|nr:CopD family protein [Alphaproteobacteria bacterium]
MNWFDLLRGLHIIAVIAWMAGMMYLPRLYAYHTETAPPGSEFDAHFKVWEAKLLKIIINPSMVITWIFGLSLIINAAFAGIRISLIFAINLNAIKNSRSLPR